MRRPCFLRAGAVLLLLACGFQGLAGENLLPRTQPLTVPGDLSAQMVAGIDSFLLRETDRSIEGRPAHWARVFSSPDAYVKSIEPNRQRFRTRIGAVDARLSPVALEFIGSPSTPAKVAETDGYTVYAVRWPVFEGVFGEGLLLQPKSPAVARIVAIPDADQTPEMLTGLAPGVSLPSQFARRLAEQGCQVLVPVLVNRQDTWSGNAVLQRFTNQPHREWIYRQAFELGRHIIGYEVQMILAAVDWLALENQAPAPLVAPPGGALPRPLKLGVVGFAEGGLLAFYSAALDPRLDAALVSGYFDSRQKVWEEPIYRNVFGLLEEFGDAEIATLIAPRRLIVEQSEAPKVAGPPVAREGRHGAAPGKWGTPDFNTVDTEIGRANALLRPLGSEVKLIHGNEGMSVGPGSERALKSFLDALGVPKAPWRTGQAASDLRSGFDPAPRQKRQCLQWVEHTQRLLRLAERDRNEFFWKPMAGHWDESDYRATTAGFKSNLWNEVIGRFPKANLPAHPRSRKVFGEPLWTGYDVVLDVWPDVYAWGVLLLPKDLKPGERRPVVVCQHGLEGVPADTITRETTSTAYGHYQAFSARLAERGFIVFAPHNPYGGGERFRALQRKANPLGKSLFSVILAQHDRILDWLSEQPFVDPERIGFYGLSYGGVSAMRLPALLDRYALSICSAAFNEWILKNATVDSPHSYLFTGEYEMPEFNLGRTFNNAEMAALIAPRPFMVERGRQDGVAPDEWVAYEYTKVRRLYASLGVPERTALEVFNGPHSIHGQDTFAFLHQHLHWPEPR